MMPKGAEILTVGFQNYREITIWALVDPDAEMIERFFMVRGTGHPVELRTDQKFLGTVFDGPFVWHVWMD
jgi:hypothetical protein